MNFECSKKGETDAIWRCYHGMIFGWRAKGYKISVQMAWFHTVFTYWISSTGSSTGSCTGSALSGVRSLVLRLKAIKILSCPLKCLTYRFSGVLAERSSSRFENMKLLYLSLILASLTLAANVPNRFKLFPLGDCIKCYPGQESPVRAKGSSSELHFNACQSCSC